MKETKIFAQFLIRNILKENREEEEKEGEAEGGQGFQTTHCRPCRLGPSTETTRLLHQNTPPKVLRNQEHLESGGSVIQAGELQFP